MKNILTLLTAVMLINSTFGQAEKPSYKAVADSFELNYNAGNFDAIYAKFSPEMQSSLPPDKTREFLTGLQQQAGKIIARTFVNYIQTYASYKTTFEKALFAVNISVDNNSKINGLFVKPFTENNLPQPERNETPMALPFKGEWTVIWGGDTKALNYHVEHEAQKNAFDLVITDAKGKSFKTDGSTNKDYYAFGQELLAPCDGEVVLVVDGIKDNVPGTMNPVYVPGNSVIIKTANNEYLFFAHFKQHSIKVLEGQKVVKGQFLGLCGNSGNSSEPHLHFHVQNAEDMNMAIGIKCYFDKIIVNGRVMTDYSPIQKDKIRRDK
ncbi:DUF3887 domain-containing protein [Niabella sp. CJ426]|uniref:DUF3887 domain-containing protein n=1 Tax=Niabella sp. CJ426 TaxID=3393740 RepID=UPI003CFEA09D